ncbi:hypothetical protein BC826DRAFT_966491 [Russula brevipes]|nr:hypothetical protein BC826DRAFT_966491 [Russula brevipes]
MPSIVWSPSPPMGRISVCILLPRPIQKGREVGDQINTTLLDLGHRMHARFIAADSDADTSGSWSSTAPRRAMWLKKNFGHRASRDVVSSNEQVKLGPPTCTAGSNSHTLFRITVLRFPLPLRPDASELALIAPQGGCLFAVSSLWALRKQTWKKNNSYWGRRTTIRKRNEKNLNGVRAFVQSPAQSGLGPGRDILGFRRPECEGKGNRDYVYARRGSSTVRLAPFHFPNAGVPLFDSRVDAELELVFWDGGNGKGGVTYDELLTKRCARHRSDPNRGCAKYANKRAGPATLPVYANPTTRDWAAIANTDYGAIGADPSCGPLFFSRSSLPFFVFFLGSANGVLGAQGAETGAS